MATNATRHNSDNPPDTTVSGAVSADPLLPDPTQLAALGNVSTGYRHIGKQVSPADGLALPGGYLKWYDIHRDDAAIPTDTRDQARDFLRAEASAGRLDLRDELGFVILHRCGEDFYYLLACTFRNDNEMWQTGYGRQGDDAFALVNHDGTHRATQCVWELAATSHERLAWTRYLRSERDEAAKRAYLADVFTGAA
ncbi:MAG TPA: hypothetical protein VFX16_23940 [Pseudonocardiaceae bacterium]|nr:hypothetical protein [Pseudonocardiaceae bacterium]